MVPAAEALAREGKFLREALERCGALGDLISGLGSRVSGFRFRVSG